MTGIGLADDYDVQPVEGNPFGAMADSPQNYDVQPVDHDPFASYDVEPVDYDPFAANQFRGRLASFPRLQSAP